MKDILIVIGTVAIIGVIAAAIVLRENRCEASGGILLRSALGYECVRIVERIKP